MKISDFCCYQINIILSCDYFPSKLTRFFEFTGETFYKHRRIFPFRKVSPNQQTNAIEISKQLHSDIFFLRFCASHVTILLACTLFLFNGDVPAWWTMKLENLFARQSDKDRKSTLVHFRHFGTFWTF